MDRAVSTLVKQMIIFLSPNNKNQTKYFIKLIVSHDRFNTIHIYYKFCNNNV